MQALETERLKRYEEIVKFHKENKEKRKYHSERKRNKK
jgi:hypothetical protein